jgi:ferredoxin
MKNREEKHLKIAGGTYENNTVLLYSNWQFSQYCQKIGRFVRRNPIAKVWQQTEILANTENVGFVFPLYFSGIPDIVEQFVKKLEFENAKYVFAIVTRGGSSADAFGQLDKLLRTKSKRLNMGWYIRMPNNYIIPFYYKYTCPQGEKRQALYRQADAETREIAELITAQRNLIKEKNVVLNTFARLMRAVYLLGIGDVHRRDTSFCLDETCNSCGICEKVCPVGNITLSEGKPRWQHHCQHCMACIQLCPQEAIQYGKQTKGKPRYRHPEIMIKDIIAQSGHSIRATQ